jgi:hypothetical protein
MKWQSLITEMSFKDIQSFYETPLAFIGFIVVVIYPTKEVILHKSFCECVPLGNVSVRATSRKINKTSRFWFADSRCEAFPKINEFYRQGYTIVHCTFCNP